MANQLEFDLSVVPQFDTLEDIEDIGQEFVVQTELARDLDFDGVHVSEHHATPDTYLLNEVVLAHIVEHIGDMQISTGMCLLPYHNPVRIAEFGASMDVLSGGNFRLGVAQGYRDKEFHVFDVDRQKAIGRLTEGIEVIKRLWTQDEVSFEGDYFEFDEISINPRPVQSPRPKIVMGASNESSIRRAARIADGWIGAHVPLGVANKQFDAFYDEADRLGRTDVISGLTREIYVAEETELAEKKVQQYLMEKYQSYTEWGQDDAIDGDTFHAEWNRIKEDRFIVGDPDHAIREIERYQESLDLDVLSIRTRFPGMDLSDVCSSIQLIGEEVIPSFR